MLLVERELLARQRRRHPRARPSCWRDGLDRPSTAWCCHPVGTVWQRTWDMRARDADVDVDRLLFHDWPPRIVPRRDVPREGRRIVLEVSVVLVRLWVWLIVLVRVGLLV